MFVVGCSEPVASNAPPLARKATKGLVKIASELVSGWSEAYIDTFSKSFGNFDRVVALGWLLGDALGWPLLDRAASWQSALPNTGTVSVWEHG